MKRTVRFLAAAEAENGRAQAVVTFNIRDFGAATARFGVELLRPREALTLLKG